MHSKVTLRIHVRPASRVMLGGFPEYDSLSGKHHRKDDTECFHSGLDCPNI